MCAGTEMLLCSSAAFVFSHRLDPKLVFIVRIPLQSGRPVDLLQGPDWSPRRAWAVLRLPGSEGVNSGQLDAMNVAPT